MNSSNAIPPKTEQEEEEEELNQLKLTLPKEQWFNNQPMYLYQGCWIEYLDPVVAFQTHFRAQDTDIFITSCRKTGTTWIKSLLFSICNRAKSKSNHSPFSESSSHPLFTHNPHELVPQFESNIYLKSKCPDLSNLSPPPRLFGTHLPFECLPTSIKEDHSKCKIVYICRNPFDTFVSSWLFYQKLDENKGMLKPDMMGKFFELFCEGKIPFGPLEDHVLGYWKQSVERPEKVLFVKYEDLKVDPKPQLKKIAEFVGFPFSEEEEREGVIDGIIELCSFQSLKEAEPKTARVNPRFENKWLFRKGEIGDWVNYLTPTMAEQLGKIMEEKFSGSGLTFN